MNACDAVRGPWYRSTLAIALVGSLLLWSALPPLACGWLAWVAPVPWLLLIRVEKLPGRYPFWALYVAGLSFWLAAVHWLRLPHPLVHFGWLALSLYLAIYLPLFVGLSRVAVHRLGIPLWFAAPVVWTGLELARAHVMTGFLMASLAHTQIHRTRLIQISDLVGEYGVGFLVMLVAACLADGLRIAKCGLRAGAANPQSAIRFANSFVFAWLPAAVALAAALAYGHWRWSVLQPATDNPTVRIALIQGNSLADWKRDETKQRQIMDAYVALSQRAIGQARAGGDRRPLDLVVWPETMFRTPLMSFDSAYQLPRDARQTKEEMAGYAPRDLARLAAICGVPVLVGIDRLNFEGEGYKAPDTDPRAAPAKQPQDVVAAPRAYNSAVLVDRQGQIVGTYDKVHLVMFGEYVPFSRWLPFLKGMSSLTGSVDAGEGPAALCSEGICYAPSICYETVIPHVIRRQVVALVASGRPPDVLVNVTNDAWYWGSSELDMHLACGVFRSVETRRPLVIAANGGISAWIDHAGRIRAQSPRMAEAVIIADVELFRDAGLTLYMRAGDWFAGACLACCVTLAAVGWTARRRSLRNPEP
jgi:apolipoprotein N-acyltransferase